MRSMTEGIVGSVSERPYPLRHFVTPPLTIRGGMGVGVTPPLTIRGGIFYYGSLVQREPACAA